MRALVIGLGSMGRRRARLLSDLDPDIEVVGVDLSEDRRAQATEELGISTFSTIDAALSVSPAQVALICTPPATHAPIVTSCLERNLNVFTELNLTSDAYGENMALARERGLTLFMSSTFLYRKETMRIAQEVAGSAGTYSYHVGQYLPDWHPWESWKDFFVANPKTSGVRELLAIELPWLQGAFGAISNVRSTTRMVSDLGLPYDDSAILMIEHESGTVGTVTVDVVCRKAVRKFEYTDENRYVTWGGTPDTLEILDVDTGKMNSVDLYEDSEAEHREGYASFVVENAYRDELAAFLDAVAGRKQPPYGFEDDLKTLSIIDEIEAGE